MINSRIFLSFSAFLVGALTIYGFQALGAQSPVTTGPDGIWRVALELALTLGLSFFWLKIFFRKRGRPVVIGSRLWLSISALYLGVLVMDLALISGYFVSFRFDTLSFLVIYNGCALCHVGFWVMLFFRRRRQPTRDPKSALSTA